MRISIERERNTPTPGKSPRYRARVRVTSEAPAVFISARNFGSVVSAKNAMDDFFTAVLDLRDAGGLPRGLHWWEVRDHPDVRAEAEVIVHDTPAIRVRDRLGEI